MSGQIISCFLVLQNTHACTNTNCCRLIHASIDSDTLVDDVLDTPVCVISIYYKTECNFFVGVKSILEDIVIVDS